MARAAAASRSMPDCTVAAVRSNRWRSWRSPPTNIAAPRTSRMLPRIEPISDALTTSCRPAPSAKSAMISSGALPKVTLSRPPIPGPERAASSSVALPISAAVGMTPSAEAEKISVALTCASSSATAIGMNGTRRYGHPWPEVRKLPRRIGCGSLRGVDFLRMPDPSHTALGAWGGGRYLHFGEPLDDDRLIALLRPDDGLRTVLTADAYGAGEADVMVGRALSGLARDSYSLVGAVGHDFYEGERQGAKGFPRFTDPSLRGEDQYADYLRMATERSLERLGVDAFDLLLLHNPDLTGYSSEAVWEGMEALRAAGLTRLLGVAPGPANGFTLDVISCFERFGSSIDWAMIILNPLEPWPGELCLEAAAAHDVRTITRVVDYGGLFWDDVLPAGSFRERDHRLFRPKGWIEAGRERMERIRPIAERHGLTMLQLAAQWNLAHPTVECVVPTLIQESGPEARSIEDKRAELASLPAEVLLDEDEVAGIRAIGDNAGSMALKGATPDHEGPVQPDRWPMSEELSGVAQRWRIDPERELTKAA